MRFPRWPGSMSRRVRKEIALAKRLVAAHMTTDVYERDCRNFAGHATNGVVADNNQTDAGCNGHTTTGSNGNGSANGGANGSSHNGAAPKPDVAGESLPANGAAHSVRTVTFDPAVLAVPEEVRPAAANGCHAPAVNSAPCRVQPQSPTCDDQGPTRATEIDVERNRIDAVSMVLDNELQQRAAYQPGWFDKVSCYVLLAVIAAIGVLFLVGIVRPLL